MPLISIAFLLGDLYVQSCAVLPSLKWLLLLLALNGILLITTSQKLISKIALAFLCGVLWTTWFATQLLQWNLSKDIEVKALTIQGYVASIPIKNTLNTNFLFALEKLGDSRQTNFKTIYIRLNVGNKINLTPLHVGDKWQFSVKLKRIHGLQNPGSFDYEAWCLQKNIRAQGYILSSKDNQFLNHSYYYLIEQLRESLGARIQHYLPHSSTAPWLMALMIGNRDLVDASDWEILRKTGTNHLMAIAGLHIGILTILTYRCIYWLWSRIPLIALYLAAHQAAAAAALIVGLSYGALSGFSLPTERAGLMLIFVISALLMKYKLNPWHIWSVALISLLLINPLITLSESFWLSFGTIALIIYAMSGRLKPNSWWWRWGRVQWIISIGLIPFTLIFFQELSLISFVANSMAIPCLEFLILPFCFLSTLLLWSPFLATYLLWIADKSLEGLWYVLTWFSTLAFATWHAAIPNYFILFTTTVAVLIFLLPNGFPCRWFASIWLLPLLIENTYSPKLNSVELNLLDVGQGLATIVKTNSHTLIFDTGAKYKTIDMGSAVLLPYLGLQNIKRIDKLVISHSDNDHLGGAQALLKALPIKSIETSEPEKVSHATLCKAGDSWGWDGIQFNYLHPTLTQLKLGNNSSCVLRISNGKKTILLTGDIENVAEQTLLNQASSLSADILIAPHHGSKTSGNLEFISAVHPRYVLYSIGYRNRYHFPHANVIEAYKTINSIQLDTATSGMISVKMDDEIKINSYRVQHKKYWYEN